MADDGENDGERRRLSNIMKNHASFLTVFVVFVSVVSSLRSSSSFSSSLELLSLSLSLSSKLLSPKKMM